MLKDTRGTGNVEAVILLNGGGGDGDDDDAVADKPSPLISLY